MKKILHVTTPDYTAQATFEKQSRGDWRCIKPTPSVDWMLIAQLGMIRLSLTNNGYEYRWEAVQPS